MFTTSLLSKISSVGRKYPLTYYESLIPSVTFIEGIPQKIYQTTKSKDSIKELIFQNIEKIKNLNPSWDFFLYDDSDIESFIQQEYGDTIYSYFKRISPEYGAAKADFFRYLVIYRFGGVYLDIKSTMNKPLSSFIQGKDSYILSYWDNLPGQSHEGNGHYPFLPDYLERGEIMQWYIIASPGHPLIKKIIATMLYNIDHYNPYIHGVGWTGTVTMTGPVMYTKVIYDTLNSDSASSFPVRWVDIISDCGFQYSIMENPAVSDGKNSSPAHTALLSSDYRKNCAPLIINKSRVLNRINTTYLTILNKRRK